MQLIGYMDSPFVRRVAISMQFLGIEYSRKKISIFREFDEFRNINPTVKIPTLMLDNGRFLVDSTLIIDYLEKHHAKRSLMPADPSDNEMAVHTIGLAMVAMEKVVQLIYETSHRPEKLQHGPWIDRLKTQLLGTVDMLEASAKKHANEGKHWLVDDQFSQADLTMAVAWRFIQHAACVNFDPRDYHSLATHSSRSEALPEFLACPVSG